MAVASMYQTPRPKYQNGSFRPKYQNGSFRPKYQKWFFQTKVSIWRLGDSGHNSWGIKRKLLLEWWCRISGQNCFDTFTKDLALFTLLKDGKQELDSKRMFSSFDSFSFPLFLLFSFFLFLSFSSRQKERERKGRRKKGREKEKTSKREVIDWNEEMEKEWMVG